MINWLELSSSSCTILKILAVMFWGMMKAFFWQSLKQAKSSGGMGWNSRGLSPPLCLVMLFEEAKPPSSLQCATQVFASWPYFNARYILRLWIVGHFPTWFWCDGGCAARCEECPTCRFLQQCSGHQHAFFFTDSKRDEKTHHTLESQRGRGIRYTH